VACDIHLKIYGRLRLGGSWFSAILGKKRKKKSWETPFLVEKLDVVAHASHPSNGSRKHKIREL
jgi:hypothetical protein